METIEEGKHEVSFNARFMADRHTHYEASTHIGVRTCGITIQGPLVNDFKTRYGGSMREYIVHARIDFIENQHHVAPDVFKSTTYLRGTLSSLDQIVRIERL